MTTQTKKLITTGRTLDHAAWGYDAINNILTFGRSQAIYREGVEILDFKPTDHILDVGCGTGSMTLEVASRLKSGGSIVGIDAAGKMIDVAEKKLRRSGLAPQCRFQTALAESLPFEDQQFDFCFNSMFFHHLPKDLKIKAFAEIFRVLKPGGVLFTIDIDRPGNFFMNAIGRLSSVLLVQKAISENLDGILPGMMIDAGFSSPMLIRRKWQMVSIWRTTKSDPKKESEA